MENATDALIMAASVLLLIVALTISISSFATLKTQVEDIVGARDEVMLAKDSVSGGYLNYLKNEDDDVRTVNVETIISALRRLRKEAYVIYISTDDLSGLPKDLKVVSNKTQKYNNDEKIIQSGAEIIKLSLGAPQGKYVEDNNVIATLYDLLKGKTFKEYIGYYQNKTAEGVSEANKQTYKIITFVKQ